MTSFRQVRKRVKVDGFHAHHLIPKQVSEHRHFAKFIASLRESGLNLDNFEENGMLLPNSAQLAGIFELPMHRGGHPLYNAMVSHHVARLMHLPTFDALLAMQLLQVNLRAGLRFSGSTPINSVRNPMSVGLEADMELIGLLGHRRAGIVRIP